MELLPKDKGNVSDPFIVFRGDALAEDSPKTKVVKEVGCYDLGFFFLPLASRMTGSFLPYFPQYRPSIQYGKTVMFLSCTSYGAPRLHWRRVLFES